MANRLSFQTFFRQATGHNPYPYQELLAQSDTLPQLLEVPTGLGKTAAITMTWLWRRFVGEGVTGRPAKEICAKTPRRLVYCLPMRVLVEQTASRARAWIENLVESNAIPLNRQPAVHVLMGGEVDRDWDRDPEREAILVGTQDQLLSRALNRGYAMSRFRWPVQFGLLNSDCLWVMDEIQLMGSGLATTTQLHAFRHMFGTALPVHSIWMSATLQREWLQTVDLVALPETFREFRLSEKDKNTPSVKKLFRAKKPLAKADCPADNAKKIVEVILEAHQQGTRTLVVVNTVKRAIEIYNAVKRKKPNPDLVLVHSRFRPGDRLKALERLLATPEKEGSICISTQVVEAGVDFSATTLITDLAPWASLVQRFGRCNRFGRDKNAKVVWLDIDVSKKGAALPYTEVDLKQAATILLDSEDVGLRELPHVSSKVDHAHVLRRKDLIDLFDTTPDLAGADIDISRFIRETDDHDVHVFWRDLSDDGPGEGEPAPSRDELCSVPVTGLNNVQDLQKWRWDHLEKRWARPGSISPGMVIMLRASDGCYNSEIGWTGKKDDIPEPVKTGRLKEEANDDDGYAAVGWQLLNEHTDSVVKELEVLLSQCAPLQETWKQALLATARWHDAGKAHEVFQKAMVGDPPEADNSVIWAKTGRGKVVYERRGFRHELASALAVLESGQSDLIAYLVAAHHGKVRMSIRSLPHETRPKNDAVRFARGIWDGDVLREVDLGGGHTLPQMVLDLSYMEFGEGPRGPSWLARMLALRDDAALGPFRLAYLEALLRGADWRASQKAEGKDA